MTCSHTQVLINVCGTHQYYSEYIINALRFLYKDDIPFALLEPHYL